MRLYRVVDMLIAEGDFSDKQIEETILMMINVCCTSKMLRRIREQIKRKLEP